VGQHAVAAVTPVEIFEIIKLKSLYSYLDALILETAGSISI